MSKRFFGDIGPVRFEGPKSDNPYAFRHYDPKRVVMGKAMAEHLRPAVCYWHNFAWLGSDMFGAPTFERPWDGETMKGAHAKADAAFEMFSTLGFPFFTFHDRDVVPEGVSLAEFGRNLEYYTGFVFEVIAPELGEHSPLAGGGRYDGLLADVGAPSAVAAVGSCIHTERLLAVLGGGSR